MLRVWLASALLALTFTSCAGGSTPMPDQASPSVHEPSAQVMSLIGRFGLAHACPVEGRIITAAHVATHITSGYQQYPVNYVYQQGALKGFLAPIGPPLSSRDISQMVVDIGDQPIYNPMAEKVEAGAGVYWFEYEYSSMEDMLRQVRRNAVVNRLVAGHVVFNAEPTAGSSGGCLFNEADEVVGIISFGLLVDGSEYKRKGAEYAGVAVNYTREWQ